MSDMRDEFEEWFSDYMEVDSSILKRTRYTDEDSDFGYSGLEGEGMAAEADGLASMALQAWRAARAQGGQGAEAADHVAEVSNMAQGDDMRAAFERDYSENGKWPQVIERNPDGEYKFIGASAAWETWRRAWQAASGRHGEPFAYYRRGRGHEMLFASDLDSEFIYGDEWTPLYAQPNPAVPEEAEAMVDAAVKVFEDAGARVDLGWLGEACRAYVAASPAPTTPGADVCRCIGSGNGCGCERCDDAPQADGWVRCPEIVVNTLFVLLEQFDLEKLADCTDSDGDVYQSEWLEQQFTTIRRFLAASKMPPAGQEGSGDEH